MLHQQAPIDFLRKHKLNCSEEIAMKKRKRVEVDTAYEEWMQSSTLPSSTLSSSSSRYGSASLLMNKNLINVYKALLLRAQARDLRVGGADKSSIVVLLLHEDYPNELGVFGNETFSDDIEHNNRIDNVTRIVCVLGAVRDMEKSEEDALIAAATDMNIPCVGANLGRAAEFTSKIAAALNAHAFYGRLSQAVSSLPLVKVGGLHRLTHDVVNNNRVDGSTMYIYVIFWANLSLDMLQKAKEELSSFDRMLASSVIQVVISTLWRSKLVSEVTACSEGDVNVEDDSSLASIITPHLTLVLSCGTTIHVNQIELAVAMGLEHRAAPSEQQILESLLDLHRSKEASKETSQRRLPNSSDVSSLILASIPIGISRKELKRMKVLDIDNIYLPGQENLEDAADIQIDNDQHIPDLTAYAYSEMCKCGNESLFSSMSIPEHVVLLCRPNCFRREDDKNSVDEALNEYCSDVVLAKRKKGKIYKHENRCSGRDIVEGKKRRRRRFYLHCQIMKESNVAPNTAITICQHFAYHGRLTRAAQLAFHQSSDKSRSSPEVDND